MPKTTRRRYLIGGLLCVALLAVAPGAGARLAIRVLEKRYPPPGKLVSIGSSRIHIYCAGEGSPTVVLESGLGVDWTSWRRVQPEVARFARVCVYDRGGYGWSDAGAEPRTAQRIADELRVLLTRAVADRSYVLVGHSFGAFVARAYAGKYRNEVAGMVLVDSPREQAVTPARPLQAGMTQQVRSWFVPTSADRQRLGRLWRGRAAVPARLAGGEPPYQDRFIYFSPETQIAAEVSELRFMDQSIEQARAARLDGTPVIVLTAGSSPRRDLAGLSERSKEVLAPRSGHFIQLDEPELVTEAVRELVLSARNNARPK